MEMLVKRIFWRLLVINIKITLQALKTQKNTQKMFLALKDRRLTSILNSLGRTINTTFDNIVNVCSENDCYTNHWPLSAVNYSDSEFHSPQMISQNSGLQVNH
jgi:hypothetical protein